MDTKTLLEKFAAFMTDADMLKDNSDPHNTRKGTDEVIADFLMTLPTDGSPVCTHCGSHEVVEADYRNRPCKPGEVSGYGPAWVCKCGYWTHRKVGAVEQSSGWK